MNHKYLRIPVLIGGIATFGFGAWHTVVPWLYGWFDYLPSLPGELTNAILAINFLLSVSLILFGVMAAVTAIWQWDNVSLRKLVLWSIAILWVLRVGYQLISPQGTMIPGLSLILLAVFTLVALCFLVPAVILQISAGKNSNDTNFRE